MTKIKLLGRTVVIKTRKEKILTIGDLHLGYEEMINLEGISLKKIIYEEGLKHLNKIFEKEGRFNKIVLLGDIKHTFGINSSSIEEIRSFLAFLKRNCEEIIVLKGNHDNGIEEVINKNKVNLKKYFVFEDVCFFHGDKKPEILNKREIKHLVIGHFHPAIRLREKIKNEKYKCFLIGKMENKKVILVPSFFEYNIGSDPREEKIKSELTFNLLNFKVFIVGEELEIFDFGILKKI